MTMKAMSSEDLVRWLDGDWALCFSHPDDFGCSDLESDRWITIVRDAFAASGVRPLIAHGAARTFDSWVTQIGGVVAQLPDLPGPVRQGERTVTVLDESLAVRRQFVYVAARGAPSPLDLVSATWMLRTAPRSAGRSADARSTLRQEMFVEQVWRGARAVTAGAARAVQLDTAVDLTCRGLLGIADQVDRHLIQAVLAGLQRGLQWLGHDPEPDENTMPFRPGRSLNGGW